LFINKHRIPNEQIVSKNTEEQKNTYFSRINHRTGRWFYVECNVPLVEQQAQMGTTAPVPVSPARMYRLATKRTGKKQES